MHRLERVLLPLQDIVGSLSADDYRKERARARLQLHGVIADTERAQRRALTGIERILHEVLDRRKHAGYELRFGHVEIGCRHVLEEQARARMHQERLLDAVDESVFHHDLRIRNAGAPRFDAPFQPLERQALIHCTIDRADQARHRFRYSFADCRTEDREDRCCHLARVTPDGLAQRSIYGGTECATYLVVATASQRESIGKLVGEILDTDCPRPQLVRDRLETRLLRAYEKRPKLLVFRC